MKLAVLGTGMVGNTIGTKLAQTGHDVMMGSRTHDNPKAVAWAESAGGNASHGTFADAAAFGEIIFNCTSGLATLQVLELAGAGNLAGKILIDISNPLDFSNGFPPTLAVCNDDSLGEQIQRAFPELNVVKTLNTLTCTIMVNPGLVAGDHTIFMSGNDAGGKARVGDLLHEAFGWKRENIIDLGDITTARGTEMILPLWLRLMGTLGTPNFNFNIVVGAV
ncbi:MAG: NAD(P)-binding domain-containing protein [Candidatus Kapaibacterium sp.]